MTKDKLLRARALIQQKRYDEARRLLASLDHPKARQWLERLNEIDPVAPVAPRIRGPVYRDSFERREAPTAEAGAQEQQKASRRPWIVAIFAGLLGFLLGLGAGLMVASDTPEGPSTVDLTRQFIIDANSTTMAQQIEATERAASPDPFELTATAITHLNATIMAQVEATFVQQTQAALASPTPASPSPTATSEPSETPVVDSPFPFETQASPSSDDSGLPFDPNAPADDSPFDSPPGPVTTEEAAPPGPVTTEEAAP